MEKFKDMSMDEICMHAKTLREQAKATENWEFNIRDLLESNNEIYEGPISNGDMEACFNYVLDLYDPNKMIEEGELPKEEYDFYINEYTGNPFWSLFDVNEEGLVVDVFLYETDDCEAVGEFLDKKYKRRS
ncbi:hypothetical protein [Flagellimonas abyssi]|uniref:Uncharacterized protein n=1 Tax=Flagellimonas abyssi TaxID=2864871 RepID=A0ABS7ELP2_9FLAO|nr:hypothetical protein [Allomuricauda abyssi]MBW8198512.1 hypothetical protein [Allomuricauda abyssi]|tara:strand:- start:162 stop:554 length:393 start_codon:yes stop_codon:yes gene_type:complete